MTTTGTTGASLTGAGDKEKRRELDFYPTPPEATIALMDYLKLDPIVEVWEPACGDGEMSKVIQSYGHNVISSDIRTNEIYGIPGINFLKGVPYRTKAIITNPPFNLSQDFIERALSIEGVEVVAMLLKSQYWHIKKNLPLFNKTKPSHVLPLTWRPDFLFKERAPGEQGRPTMEVAWTIWKTIGGGETIYKPLQKPLINKNKNSQLF